MRWEIVYYVMDHISILKTALSQVPCWLEGYMDHSEGGPIAAM